MKVRRRLSCRAGSRTLRQSPGLLAVPAGLHGVSHSSRRESSNSCPRRGSSDDMTGYAAPGAKHDLEPDGYRAEVRDEAHQNRGAGAYPAPDLRRICCRSPRQGRRRIVAFLNRPGTGRFIMAVSWSGLRTGGVTVTTPSVLVRSSRRMRLATASGSSDAVASTRTSNGPLVPGLWNGLSYRGGRDRVGTFLHQDERGAVDGQPPGHRRLRS